MIKSSSAETLVEIHPNDNSHYEVFGRDVMSQPELVRDKELAVTKYSFKEFDFDNDDDLLELELEFNE